MSHGLKIIIAEDDEGHALLIKKNLQKTGIQSEYLHFSNGEDAINFLRSINENRFDDKAPKLVILLDIKMPRMNGIEVLRFIKSDQFLKHIPVYMISTTDNKKEIEICKSLGCNSFIIKPVEYDVFASTIQKLGFSLKELDIA